MEIICVPKLSPEQEGEAALARKPECYIPPPVEGMWFLDKEHPEGLIIVYVGYCDWERDFDHCVKKFVLTVFHETMHILFPDFAEGHVPYAERLLADILYNKKEAER